MDMIWHYHIFVYPCQRIPDVESSDMTVNESTAIIQLHNTIFGS